MRRTVETAFTLMTVAEVGESLFASRPVVVVEAGSLGLLFLNAAAAQLIGASDLAAVRGQPPALPAAILAQLARFGARAEPGQRTTALVTHRDGLRPVVTACTMLRLPDLDEAPVLLLELPDRPGAPSDIAASLALLADPGRLLAAFDQDGEVLSASGDYALLDGVQDAIEDFVVAAADRPLARTRVAASDGTAEAMVARIGGSRDLRIIAIERVASPAAVDGTGSAAPAVGVVVENQAVETPVVDNLAIEGSVIAGSASGPETFAATVSAADAGPAAEAGPAADAGVSTAATSAYRDLGEPDHLLDPIFFALSPVPGPDDYGRWMAAAARAPVPTPEPAPPAQGAADAEAADTADDGADDALFAGFAAPLPHAPPYPGASSDDLRLAVDLVTHPPEMAPPPSLLPDLDPTDEPMPATERLLAAEPAARRRESAVRSDDPASDDAAADGEATDARAVAGGSAAADESAKVAGSASGAAGTPAANQAAANGSAANAAGAADRADAAAAPDGVPPAFRFAPEARPSRFVWRMDAADRFTFVSDELARAVGPQAAALAGLTWREAAARLGLDPEGRVAAALDRRQTWTVRDLLWPVEGQALRVAVDLTALPSLGRDRAFEGYQGFGLCRTGAPIPDPDAIGDRLATSAAADAPGPRAAGSAPEAALAGETAEALRDQAAASGDAPDEVEPRRTAEPAPALDEAAFAGEIDARPDAGPDDAESEAAETDAAQTDAGASVAAPIDLHPDTPSPARLHPVATAPGDEDRPAPPPGYPVPTEIGDTFQGSTGAPTVGAPERMFRPSESGRVVTVPANRGSRVVTLPGAHRVVIDSQRLSAPERIAFRQIAAALGARLEGDDAGSDAEDPEPVDGAASAAPAAPETDGLADRSTTRRDEPAPEVSPDMTPAPSGGLPTTVGSNSAAISPAGFAPTGSGSAAIMAFARPAAIPADVPEIEPATDPAPAPAVAPATGDDDVRLGSRILDRLPVGCAVLREDDLVYVNGAFLALTGYTDLAELEAVGGLDALFAGEHVARRFAEEGRTRPVPVLTRTGEVVPVAARLAPVPWGAGPALLLTLDRMPRQTADAASETASGRAALEALGEARERSAELEAIVDTATDGVIMLDGDGQVLSANRAAEALFGMDRAEMMGQGLDDLLAPESRRSAQDYLDGLARNGVASVLNDGREVIGQVRPEGLIPLFMTIGRISSGADSKFCAVLRDITQWKKSEEELTGARRRAEEASMHKSEFLAKISHEIRTPLNAIIGFSEVMLDERFGPVGTERYKDYLRDIHTSGSHIMSLINDLLDLSKVEAGKLELTFEAVSLADVAAECVAMMQPQANRERIIIRTSLPGSVPQVVADSRSVRQIVLNLLSNAVKFTPAGGQVIVSAALEDSGEVVLRVRDTGYGMTEKEIQAALEPFRQLHTARARSTGTGLGLPLTKALVEANRAAFRIDSAVNQGTLVTVTFPVTRVLAG